jgi:hypothetical protein
MRPITIWADDGWNPKGPEWSLHKSIVEGRAHLLTVKLSMCNPAIGISIVWQKNVLSLLGYCLCT